MKKQKLKLARRKKQLFKEDYMRKFISVKPFLGVPYFFEGPTAPSLEDFTKLQPMVQGLATIVQTQASQFSSVSTAIGDINKKLSAGPAGGDDGKNDDDSDVNAMDNGKLAEFLIGKVGALLDDRLKGVTTEINNTRTEFRRTKLSEEVDAFSSKHPDFNDWQDEIRALAKENPTLSIPRLYTLARVENPDKAKTVDEKYKEPEQPKDSGITLFGGFKPNGKTSVDKDGKEVKLTVDEALEKAWGEALEAVPALEKMSATALD
jgi:hypothetical protein